MIVVDTSALYAVINAEPDADVFIGAIRRADNAVMGAPTVFELRLVAHRKAGSSSSMLVDALLNRLSITTLPWTAEHIAIAQDALVRFGGRPAQLNFGDCLSYAAAKALDAPLLFKGDDFIHTDIRSAL